MGIRPARKISCPGFGDGDVVVARRRVQLVGLDPADHGSTLTHAAERPKWLLDDEASTWGEVCWGVGEHRQLVVLGRDVHDAVRNQVDERERPRDAGCRHVADRDRHCVRAGFGP
jgi:hypothetical protein